MTNTRTRSGKKSIVIFGAGKIGRSFIGQLFGRNGYHIIFVDKNKQLVEELNRRRKYKVVAKAEKDEVLEVKNFRGIYSEDKENIINAVADADILATAVGKSAFEEVMVQISDGIRKRMKISPGKPLDIILAENIIQAGEKARMILRRALGTHFPVSGFVGLAETSIGKMVPIMPRGIEEKDPLIVFTEPYNTLIIDKKAFKNPPPGFPGIHLVENIEAWVFRKALIHNLGHAAVAYCGNYHSPGSVFIAEVLELPDVSHFSHEVMSLAATLLYCAFPDEFALSELENHIDDLLMRFRNIALGDTVFRVGSDLYRKFGPDDRIIGAIRLAQKWNQPFDLYCKVAAYGLLFRATDENGELFPNDKNAIAEIENNAENFIISAGGIETDDLILETIMNYYKLLKLTRQK